MSYCIIYILYIIYTCPRMGYRSETREETVLVLSVDVLYEVCQVTSETCGEVCICPFKVL